MKKYILFLLLCFAGLGSAFASGTSLTDLLGTYECTTPGINASFELSNDQAGFVLDYCRDFGQMECLSATVFETLVEGEIMAVEGQSHRAIDGMKVEVMENENDVKIRVSTNDGLVLEFTK